MNSKILKTLVGMAVSLSASATFAFPNNIWLWDWCSGKICSGKKFSYIILDKPQLIEVGGNFPHTPWKWTIQEHWGEMDSYCGKNSNSCNVQRRVSKTVGEQYSIQTKISYKAGDVGGETLFSYSWSNSRSTTNSFTVNLKPGQNAYFYYASLQKQLTGAPLYGPAAIFENTIYRVTRPPMYQYRVANNANVGTWDGTLKRNFKTIMCVTTNPTPTRAGAELPAECRPAPVPNGWYSET